MAFFFRSLLRRLSEGDPEKVRRPELFLTHALHHRPEEPDSDCEHCRQGEWGEESEEEEEEEGEATQRLGQAEEEASETGHVQLALDSVEKPPDIA